MASCAAALDGRHLKLFPQHPNSAQRLPPFFIFSEKNMFDSTCHLLLSKQSLIKKRFGVKS